MNHLLPILLYIIEILQRIIHVHHYFTLYCQSFIVFELTLRAVRLLNTFKLFLVVVLLSINIQLSYLKQYFICSNQIKYFNFIPIYKI
jgi:hypothetical protein